MTFKCPHCEKMPKSANCLNCGEDIALWVNYCPFCGDFVSKPQEGENEKGDLTERRLCPDGNCIGILDEVGVCVTCGNRG